MKKIALMKGLMLLAVISFATDEEKKIKSNIDHVTVFQSGAQVYRTGNITLNSGVTKIIFEGVSPQINVNSIQVGGKGNFIILDVKHQIRYVEPEKSAPVKINPAILKRIHVLEDSLTELNFLLTDINNRTEVLAMEKKLLLNNKTMKGEGDTDSLPVLKEAIEYLRIRYNNINNLLLEIEREKLKITIEKSRVQADLAELKQYKAGIEKEVVKPSVALNCVEVTVSAKIPCTGVINLNYIVSGAGWSPTYDIRANSIASPVEIVYKALVYQKTGEDWKNVKLKLSTINPNRGNIKPTLAAWYLNYFMPVSKASNLSAPVTMETSQSEALSKDKQVKKELDYRSSSGSAGQSPARFTYDYTNQIHTLTNIEFEIDLPYSVPPDGETHIVAVMQKEVPTKYYHYVVPKLDPEAFLIAKLTQWEDMNLLPGAANVYFESTYIGRTQINPSIIGDTMELSLGRDGGIITTRKKLLDEDKEKITGNTVTRTMAFRISIKNNKSGTVHLIVEDQIPLSANDEIKVTLEDMTEGSYQKDTGTLKWNIQIEAKKTKEINFVYSVKSDKDKPLVMR